MKKVFTIITLMFVITISKAQTTPYRGALLEYFQGHLCPNCPRADSIAGLIKARYGDSVAIVDIHSGPFALPDTAYNFPFPDDLRCNTGMAIDTFFGASSFGIPNGMISRMEFDTSTMAHLKSPFFDWKRYVDTIINRTPHALVDHSNSFNSGTRILTSTVYTKALTNLTGNYYLSLFLTEDSIISPMVTISNSSFIDTNHVINNLLRTGINGTWGTLISSGTFAAGSILTNNFTFAVDTLWKAHHCKVVCFVYDNATKEVLQISQKALLDNSPSPLLANEMMNSSNITIFPNPFTNSTTITLSSPINNRQSTIIITDVLGKEIKTITFTGKECVIERGDMQRGIYFIRVNGEWGMVNRKMIIQ